VLRLNFRIEGIKGLEERRDVSRKRISHERDDIPRRVRAFVDSALDLSILGELAERCRRVREFSSHHSFQFVEPRQKVRVMPGWESPSSLRPWYTDWEPTLPGC